MTDMKTILFILTLLVLFFTACKEETKNKHNTETIINETIEKPIAKNNKENKKNISLVIRLPGWGIYHQLTIVDSCYIYNLKTKNKITFFCIAGTNGGSQRYIDTLEEGKYYYREKSIFGDEIKTYFNLNKDTTISCKKSV
jgi:hypothetical protein